VGHVVGDQHDADRGLGVVLITHDMTHVCEVAYRAHVLRLGRRVATLTGDQITVTSLVTAMTSGRTEEATS